MFGHRMSNMLRITMFQPENKLLSTKYGVISSVYTFESSFAALGSITEVIGLKYQG